MGLGTLSLLTESGIGTDDLIQGEGSEASLFSQCGYLLIQIGRTGTMKHLAHRIPDLHIDGAGIGLSLRARCDAA